MLSLDKSEPLPDGIFRSVCIIDDDVLLGELLAHQLRPFGYDTRLLHRLGDLDKYLETHRPDVLVVDIRLPDGNGASYIRKRREEQAFIPPVLFISAYDALEERIEAARAGGLGYHVKPLDLSLLIKRLDVLTHARKAQPYRVMIVEDQRAQAEYYCALLKAAGFEAMYVLDPLEALQAMRDFRPELLLLDQHMPSCTGQELAGALRQVEDLAGIPFVFLSSERNQDIQLDILGDAGDAFLPKPVAPDKLLAAVHSRVTRGRLLRDRMIRDSLTGLLNHAETHLQIEQRVSRAVRQKSTLAVALLDIDHFKRINDRYGHPAGDRVIKSLARLLEQSLRTHDIIGRYGGEEFLICIDQCSPSTAWAIVERLRLAFADITHDTQQTLSCTLSAGLAFLDITPQSGQQLIDAADRALCDAKHAGRNCTRKAPSLP